MIQTFRRRALNALDHPGGRRILSLLATSRARKLLCDSDVSISYDGMWIDRVGPTSIPRSRRFEYHEADLRTLRQRLTARLAASLDYWTYCYRPRFGDIVFDVGAGVGVDSIAFSRLVGTNGTVYSFEAHPWSFHALKKTCHLNELMNVRALHMAVSSTAGTVWVSDLPNDEANFIAEKPTRQHQIPVPATDIDSFVAKEGISRIALLKMNIEGAEADAIQGIRNSINFVENVVIACHDFRGDMQGTRDVVVSFLKQNGFRVAERLADPRAYVRDHVHGTRE